MVDDLVEWKRNYDRRVNRGWMKRSSRRLSRLYERVRQSGSFVNMIDKTRGHSQERRVNLLECDITSCSR